PGVEGPDAAAVGVEERAHELRLHEAPAVGDGREGRDHLDGGHGDLLADGHGGEGQGRPLWRGPKLAAALPGQAEPDGPAETEAGDVLVVALLAQLESRLDGADV